MATLTLRVLTTDITDWGIVLAVEIERIGASPRVQMVGRPVPARRLTGRKGLRPLPFSTILQLYTARPIFSRSTRLN